MIPVMGAVGTDLVPTVLVSAIVAAVVALLVEYAAKPALEGRKERILRKRRAIWDLRDALVALLERLDSLEYATREDPELAPLEREVNLVREQVWLVEDLGSKVASDLPPAIWAELSFAHGRHRAIFDEAESIRTNLRPDERLTAYRLTLRNVGSNFGIPRSYLLLPRWRWRRRRRLIGRAEERERWREHLPDADEEGWLDELAEAMLRLLGSERAQDLVSLLEEPGNAWLAALSEGPVRAIIFDLMTDVDPSDESRRKALARQLREHLSDSEPSQKPDSPGDDKA